MKRLILLIFLSVRALFGDVVLVDEPNKRYVVIWTEAGTPKIKLCIAIPEDPARTCYGTDVQLHADMFWEGFHRAFPAMKDDELCKAAERLAWLSKTLGAGMKIIDRGAMEKEKQALEAKIQSSIENMRVKDGLRDDNTLEIDHTHKTFRRVSGVWEPSVVITAPTEGGLAAGSFLIYFDSIIKKWRAIPNVKDLSQFSPEYLWQVSRVSQKREALEAWAHRQHALVAELDLGDGQFKYEAYSVHHTRSPISLERHEFLTKEQAKSFIKLVDNEYITFYKFRYHFGGKN